jgi:hypothetical protein
MMQKLVNYHKIQKILNRKKLDCFLFNESGFCLFSAPIKKLFLIDKESSTKSESLLYLFIILKVELFFPIPSQKP